MAFVEQQDIPVAGANAYASVAFFKSYHDSRGNVVTATDTEIEHALVKATSYLDIRFKFVGYRDTKDQTTEWPRDDAWDDRGDSIEGVPDVLRRATSEYALRALSADLMGDPTRDASGRIVTERSESVGPLKETVKYADGALSYDLPDYPFADRMLSSRGLLYKASRRGLRVGNVGR